MKILAAIAAALTAAFLLYASLPAQVKNIEPRPLPPGKTNPPLRQLDASTPIPPGAQLWTSTNLGPIGRVIAFSDHRFPSGENEPGVLVKLRSSEQWIPRRSLDGSWTDL